ncbi:CDP-alcohol phosphatidyltransferase family protein [soil metagenome]
MGSAQKPGRGAPPYSRWVNRRLGRWLAALAYGLRLTPNAVTGISALFTFTGLALVALVPPAWWLGIVVGLCLVLGYALDSADGQLARLTGSGSRAGEWLDHMVDITKTCALHILVLVSFVRFGGTPGQPFLLVPLAYLTVAVVFFFGIMLTDQLRRAAAIPGVTPPARTDRGLVQTLIALPTDYGILCLVFLFFGWRPGFLVMYALMFAAHTIVLGGALGKWWRDLTALDLAAASRK